MTKQHDARAVIVRTSTSSPSKTAGSLPSPLAAMAGPTSPPAADTRVVYVSSSAGSDSNNGLSSGARRSRRSPRRARSLRNGSPDWMLLKRGDAWSENLSGWNAVRPRRATSRWSSRLRQRRPADAEYRHVRSASTTTAARLAPGDRRHPLPRPHARHVQPRATTARRPATTASSTTGPPRRLPHRGRRLRRLRRTT